MLFRQLLHEEASCASYVVGCPSKGVASVIDAQGDVERYLGLAERHRLRITDVMDTHVHADHRSATRELAAKTGARLHLGAGAQVGFDFLPLNDGDTLKVGNRKMEVLHTPGHTPEHVSLLVDDWFVLTGDTLFVGDVGRVDLALQDVFDGELRDRARQLHSSLQKLSQLPPETEVYPGHYAGSTCGRGMDGKPISTIGRELGTNRVLALEVEEFIDYQLSSPPPVPDDFERIKRANLAGE